MKTVAVYLQDGLADWEAGFILPTLREAGYRILSFGEAKTPMKTMGGLTLLPEFEMKDLDWNEIEMVILPGGDGWTDPARNKALLDVLPALKNVKIAAIFAATVALARIGMLDGVKHATNFAEFMNHFAPNYKGQELGKSGTAVTDGNIITSAGYTPLEFSHEILKSLKFWDEKKSKEWFEFYKNGTVPETWIP